MQQPKSWVLLSAILSTTAVAAGSLPRGVGPEFASFYEGKDEFSCISNSALKISRSRINDNSCDCPDGSDEPGTAACAFIDPLSPEQPLPGTVSGNTNSLNALPGFWCANKGHIGTYIPFSFVNDGVCDSDLCCDGTEEYGRVGGVKCPNRCAEIGKEYRRLEEERRNKMERAGKQRGALTREAQELRRHAELRLTELEAVIKTLDAKKVELQKRHAEVEREDRGKVVHAEGSGGKLGVLVAVAKKRVQELRETLGQVVDERDDLRGRVEELETLLKKFKEEYNPNFNDEGVKAAVKSFEDYSASGPTPEDQIPQSEIMEILKEDDETSGVNWRAFDDLEGDDTDILYSFEAYLPGFLRNILHEKLDGVRQWFVDNGLLADTAKEGTESRRVKSAREALEAAERDHLEKSKEIEQTKADLAKDYGPADIFRALKGKCVDFDAGEYTYQHCWYDKTSQNSKKGHGNTNMGNFEKMEREMADDEERLDGKSLGKGLRMVMKFENGQGCWNGPNRRTDVWLGCAEKEEIWRVAEAEKCVYKMEVGTPAACEVEEAVVRQLGKDEL